MPTGVAAVWAISTRVPTVRWSGPRYGASAATQVHSTKAIICAVAKTGGISVAGSKMRACAGTDSASLTVSVALWRKPGFRSARVIATPSPLVLQDGEPGVDVGQVHQPVGRDIDVVRLDDPRPVGAR